MPTVDDKIDAATTDMTEAFAKDLSLIIQVFNSVYQALAALHSMHPMAPAVMAVPMAKLRASLDQLSDG